jgi:PKHD-type hydroxylase
VPHFGAPMTGFLLNLGRPAAPDVSPIAHGTTNSDSGAIGDAGFICTPMKFPGTFSPAECAAVVELGVSAAPILAGLAHPIENYRTGITKAIALDSQSRWVYEKLREVFSAVNQWYRFEISAMIDSLLYCEYPESGHFDWHIDCGEFPTGTRKISLSLQLSDYSEYTGGALEFAAYGELTEARRLGTVITFPAFLHHRVAAVTSGVRRSLVAWAHGPVFR